MGRIHGLWGRKGRPASGRGAGHAVPHPYPPRRPELAKSGPEDSAGDGFGRRLQGTGSGSLLPLRPQARGRGLYEPRHGQAGGRRL